MKIVLTTRGTLRLVTLSKRFPRLISGTKCQTLFVWNVTVPLSLCFTFTLICFSLFFWIIKKIFKKGDHWKFLKKITQKYKVRALAGSVSSYFPSLPHYWSCWKDEILDRLGRAILSTFCTAVFQAAVTFAITTNKWYFLYNIHAFHNVLALKDVSLFLT